MEKTRCSWCGDDPLYLKYHDEEWGVPVHDDRHFFELLTLEGAQAGLSWMTVLRKRETYREAFDDYNIKKIAAYTDEKIEKLVKNPGIIRNRLKINSVRHNAEVYLRVQDEFGSFDKYIWQFTGGKTIVNSFIRSEDIPATSPESDALSSDMKKRGFKFCGSTICYALMQSAGLFNDHLVSCFRYSEAGRL